MVAVDGLDRVGVWSGFLVSLLTPDLQRVCAGIKEGSSHGSRTVLISGLDNVAQRLKLPEASESVRVLRSSPSLLWRAIVHLGSPPLNQPPPVPFLCPAPHPNPLPPRPRPLPHPGAASGGHGTGCGGAAGGRAVRCDRGVALRRAMVRGVPLRCGRGVGKDAEVCVSLPYSPSLAFLLVYGGTMKTLPFHLTPHWDNKAPIFTGSF